MRLLVASSRYRESSMPAIRSVLDGTSNPAVVRAAIPLLDDPRVIEACVAQLDSEWADVRRQAVLTLAKAPLVVSRSVIARRTADADPSVRLAAVCVLDRWKLEDGDDSKTYWLERRRAAIAGGALSKLGDVASLSCPDTSSPAVAKVLRRARRRHCAWLFRNADYVCRHPDIEHLMSRSCPLSRHTRRDRILDVVDDAEDDQLDDFVQTGRPALVSGLLESALRRRRLFTDADLLARIRGFVTDPTLDLRVRWSAARYLGALRFESALGSLTAALGDPDERMRLYAIDAIAKIGKAEPKAIAALRRLIARGDPATADAREALRILE